MSGWPTGTRSARPADGRAGAKPRFSDREVSTLLLLSWLACPCLLDTKPLPVIGHQRDKGRRDFAATADYGVCARRNLKYVGYKPVLLCTPAGVPAACELVPASTDEPVAGEPVRDGMWQARILSDQGCLGTDEQQGCWETRGLTIPPPARRNQHTTRPAGFEGWLHRLRERSEGTFHEVRNTGRHPGHPACRTVRGLCTQVAAKMASHAPDSCSAVRPGLTAGPSPWPCDPHQAYCNQTERDIHATP